MTTEQANQLQYIHSKIGTVIAGGIENASIQVCEVVSITHFALL